jgi:hypothetical protein
MKVVDPFMHPKRRGNAKRGAHQNTQFVVQVGNPGPSAEAAVQSIVALGKRQKIGRRLGASAVIKAERR